jgi:hypothetical protein
MRIFYGKDFMETRTKPASDSPRRRAWTAEVCELKARMLPEGEERERKSESEREREREREIVDIRDTKFFSEFRMASWTTSTK